MVRQVILSLVGLTLLILLLPFWLLQEVSGWFYDRLFKLADRAADWVDKRLQR